MGRIHCEPFFFLYFFFVKENDGSGSIIVIKPKPCGMGHAETIIELAKDQTPTLRPQM